jgi:hypothetical protein
MSISTTGGRPDVAHEATDPRGPVIDLTTEASEVLEVSASSRPTFTITDAASSCSVSRKTITRKLPELAIHGAAKDDDGVWRIPVEALLAVGLHPGRSLPQVAPLAARTAPVAPIPARDPQQDTVTIPRDRWDDVRIRLARAEAEAAERALALADARLALRALTAGPTTASRAPDLQTRGQVSSAIPVTPSSDVAPPAPVASTGHAGTTADGAPTSPLVATAGAAGLVADAAGQAAGAGPVPGGDPAAAPLAVAAPQAPASVPPDVIAARNLAARTGGYVPAGTAPGKKRRWWQSH